MVAQGGTAESANATSAPPATLMPFMWRATGTNTPLGTVALVTARETWSGVFSEGIAGPALPAGERAILEDDDSSLEIIVLLSDWLHYATRGDEAWTSVGSSEGEDRTC